LNVDLDEKEAAALEGKKAPPTPEEGMTTL
jgi:hypothetical protein